MPSTTHVAYVRTRNLQWYAREVPRRGVLVEEHGAMVLVGDVEILLEETAGHEACPSWMQMMCQGPLRWSAEVR